MPTPYKLKILNGIVKLKTLADYTFSLLGIKDLGTQTGEVTAGYVDWSIQHLTKTTAEWTADTTTILLRGQLGVEDTGNTTFKIKIGNGIDLWSALGYSGGGGSSTWGGITGTLSDQTDLQDELNLKSNLASPTFTGTITTPAIVVSSETASRVAIIDASNNVKSADTTTYPSLAELAYVKNVTSAIQTQINETNFLNFQFLNFNPAASTIYYLGNAPVAPITATSSHRVYSKKAFTSTKCRISLRMSGTPSNENASLALGISNSFTNVTTTIDFSAVSGGVLTYLITGLNLSITTSDYYQIRLSMGANTTMPTALYGTVEFY